MILHRLTRHVMAIVLVMFLVGTISVLMAAPAHATAPDEAPAIALNLNIAILWTFLGITFLLVLKQIFAVGSAIKDKTFDWRQLPGILQTNVLPYLVPLAAMAAVSLVMPLVALAYGYFGVQYIAKLIADIRENAARYFGLSAPPDAPTPNQTE